MGIRPVDLQVIIPKTAEYSKQHQGEINKQNFDQQMFTQVSSKNAEERQSIVIETNEAERSVDEDGGNNPGQEAKGNKKRRRGEAKGKEKKQESQGLFDMRI